MGDLNEFKLKHRVFLKAYRWREIRPTPWHTLSKPLSQCRVAIASSAGFVMPHQEPFDDTIKGGDPSFREISGDIEPSLLRESHRSDAFDHAGLRRDPNLAFPLSRLRELADDGQIGHVNHRHLSFMGSITAPGRLIKVTAPAAVQSLVADEVDSALLIPV